MSWIASETASPTSLGNGEPSELHQLVNGEGAGAHQLLVKGRSGFGTESLSTFKISIGHECGNRRLNGYLEGHGWLVLGVRVKEEVWGYNAAGSPSVRVMEWMGQVGSEKEEVGTTQRAFQVV